MKEAPMKDLAGKVAFITGGGSGVALGQAKAFAAAGMKIVIADIRRDHLDAVLRHQQVVESIAVIAAVADQAPREVGEEPRVEGGGDEVWLIR